MGSMHLKLGVLVVVAAAVAGIASGNCDNADYSYDCYNFHIEVNTPIVAAASGNVLLGFLDQGNNGWLNLEADGGLALGTPSPTSPLSPDGPPRHFHTVQRLVDPCRLLLQLKPDAGNLAWTPFRVKVVVYTIAANPEDQVVKYRREFTNIPGVTPLGIVEVNQCWLAPGTT
jgi:hypothetical protein